MVHLIVFPCMYHTNVLSRKALSGEGVLLEEGERGTPSSPNLALLGLGMNRLNSPSW